MVRLNVLLLIAVLASALYLVHTQYRSRLLFTELDRVTNEARRLEVDGERLQVEKRAQATPLRIEKLAHGPEVVQLTCNVHFSPFFIKYFRLL